MTPAGRPRLDHGRVHLRLPADEIKAINDGAKAEGMSLSGYCSFLFRLGLRALERRGSERERARLRRAIGRARKTD